MKRLIPLSEPRPTMRKTGHQIANELLIAEPSVELDAADLALLQHTSDVLVRELDPSLVAILVTDAIESLFSGPRAAAVILQQADGPRALAHTRYGLNGELRPERTAERVTDLLRRSTGGGIIAWVIEHGHAVRLGDVRKDPRYLQYDPRVRSELCVPIPGPEMSVLGAINVESAEENAFSARDEKVLGVAANHIGTALRNAHLYRKARDNEALYRRMFESNPHPMWVYDRKTLAFLAVNDAAVAHYGYSRDEFLGMTLRDIRPPDDIPFLESNVAIAPRGYDKPDVWRHRLKDGRVIKAEISSNQIEFESCDAKLVLARDVTERYAAQEEQRLHAAVVASTRDGIVVTDLEGRVSSVNRAFCDISGYSESQILGQSLAMLRGPTHDEGFEQMLLSMLRESGEWRGESWVRHRDGSELPAWLSFSSVCDEMDRALHYVGILTDISQLKAAQARTEHLANYDALTQLPNRTLIGARLEHALRRAVRYEFRVAVLYLDLDRFKNVNDSFGHDAGDTLLCKVASLLKNRMRDGDLVGRLSGDEFLIVMESVRGPEDAARLARSLQQQLDAVVTIGEGRQVHVGASIGVSLFPEDGREAAELVRNADSAMYQAKQQGRRSVCFYDRSLTEASQERLELEMSLRAAIKAQALTLHYQPIVDMSGQRLLGAEALLRWTLDSGEMVPPLRFVPIAEETGLIVALGDWVLQHACAQMRRWQDAGHVLDLLAVNVSPRQLDQGDLQASVAGALREHGIDAACLELEITESGIMQRTERIESQLCALKSIGVRLAIDDFGTGYSSLAHLKNFPVDKLKIDHSFIDDIPGDGADLQIATAIIALARSLNLEVLAEGVETETQRQLLAERQCDAFQGFLVSLALSADEFARRFLLPATR